MKQKRRNYDSLTFTERKYDVGIIQELRTIAIIKKTSLTSVVEEAILKYLEDNKAKSFER